MIDQLRDAWHGIDGDDHRDRSLPRRTNAELQALYAIPPRKRPPRR